MARKLTPNEAAVGEGIADSFIYLPLVWIAIILSFAFFLVEEKELQEFLINMSLICLLAPLVGLWMRFSIRKQYYGKNAHKNPAKCKERYTDY